MNTADCQPEQRQRICKMLHMIFHCQSINCEAIPIYKKISVFSYYIHVVRIYSLFSVWLLWYETKHVQNQCHYKCNLVEDSETKPYMHPLIMYRQNINSYYTLFVFNYLATTTIFFFCMPLCSTYSHRQLLQAFYLARHKHYSVNVKGI